MDSSHRARAAAGAPDVGDTSDERRDGIDGDAGRQLPPHERAQLVEHRCRIDGLAIASREIPATAENGQLSGAHRIAEAHAEVATERGDVGRLILGEEERRRSIRDCPVTNWSAAIVFAVPVVPQIT